jgi:hypothetical protein
MVLATVAVTGNDNQWWKTIACGKCCWQPATKVVDNCWQATVKADCGESSGAHVGGSGRRRRSNVAGCNINGSGSCGGDQRWTMVASVTKVTTDGMQWQMRLMIGPGQ